MPETPRQPTRAEIRKRRAKEFENFAHAKKVEKHYARQLRGVAEQVGRIIRGFSPHGEVRDEPGLQATLKRYSDLLGPWAMSVSSSLITELSRKDENAWIKMGETIGRNLRDVLRHTPVGVTTQKLMHEQVTLIKSLPLKAGERVHKLVLEGLVDSSRASTIAQEIMRSGHVTKSRATLIARTESARASTTLTKARAQQFGATHYRWHSQSDSDVRPMHKKLNGHVFSWREPPVAEEDGQRHAPGEFPNCRCWAEPIFND